MARLLAMEIAQALANGKGPEDAIDMMVAKYAPQGNFRRWSGFTWGIRAHSWDGIIPHEGPLEGVLVSVLNGAPWVLQDYPPTAPQRIYGDTRLHARLPGAEIRLVYSPAGDFWGRSRQIEYIERNARYNQNLMALLEVSNQYEGLRQFCRELPVMVSGVLLSKHLPGDCADEARFVVYDVLFLDRERWLLPSELAKLSKFYRLPCVEAEDPECPAAGGDYYVKNYTDGEVGWELVTTGPPADPLDAILLEIWTNT